MRVDEGEVEVFERLFVEGFVDIPQCLDVWLEFFHGCECLLVEFEVVLDLNSKKFCGCFLFERFVVE